MGVAPVANTRMRTEVFLADIVATDPGTVAVHHQDLAVVAEVELEAVAAPLCGIEGGDLYPHPSQLPAQARAVKVAAANLVVEDVNADPCAGAIGEQPTQALPQAVVADDIGFQQDIVLGGGDAL